MTDKTAVSQSQGLTHGILQVCMGATDGFNQGKPPGQPGGNGGRERATAAMGVGCLDARDFKFRNVTLWQAEAIDEGVPRQMPPLEQNGGAELLTQVPYRCSHGCEGVGVTAGQGGGFVQIGGDECSLRQEFAHECFNGVRLQQNGPAGADHDGIDDGRGGAGFDESCGHADQVLRKKHAGFDGADREVGTQLVELSLEEFGIQLPHLGDPQGILGGQGGERGNPENTLRGKGKEVGLYPCPGSGVRTGNGQRNRMLLFGKTCPGACVSLHDYLCPFGQRYSDFDRIPTQVGATHSSVLIN